MHIAQINFGSAPPGWTPAEILEKWPSLADIADAAASAGTRVSVIQAATCNERLTRAGVEYHFTDVSALDGVAARGRHFAGMLRDIGAELLHVHGLRFAPDACAVTRHAPDLPVLFQDHADRPPRWWRRPQWRRWYAGAAGAAFTTPELARPYTAAGIFGPRAEVFAIPESSSRFTPGSRATARAETGLYGDPCVLWVGHLNRGKDPLTVLKGVALALQRLPCLQLWCAFGNAPLLADMRRCIAGDPRLAGRVHLLGKVPHASVELLMRAADLFVAGSHAESCGYAVLEALACGIAPVITDIPAFRALTGGGRIGRLWPCGNAPRLAEALIDIAAMRPASQSVRAHFDDELSFPAVGRRWMAAYASVIGARRRKSQ